MKINLGLDAGNVFDLISISAVKVDNNIGDEKALNHYKDLMFRVAAQIGASKLEQIMRSPEYIKLYDKNAEIYNMVDFIKKVPTDALIIDGLNIARYGLKQELQRKFFGSEIGETKHGY